VLSFVVSMIREATNKNGWLCISNWWLFRIVVVIVPLISDIMVILYPNQQLSPSVTDASLPMLLCHFHGGKDRCQRCWLLCLLWGTRFIATFGFQRFVLLPHFWIKKIRKKCDTLTHSRLTVCASVSGVTKEGCHPGVCWCASSVGQGMR